MGYLPPVDRVNESSQNGTHLDKCPMDDGSPSVGASEELGLGDRDEQSGFLTWLSPSFRDQQVEQAFFCHKHDQTPYRLRQARLALCILAALWILLPSDLPLTVWRFYRINNVLSAAGSAVAVARVVKLTPSTWSRYDDACMIPILHNLLYNSLTAEQVGKLAGIYVEPLHDECYQLMFCLLGIVGFYTSTRCKLSGMFLLMHVGLVLWLAAALSLGTGLSTQELVKTSVLYYAICAMTFLNARHGDIEERRQFSHELRLVQDSKRHRALLEGARRMLAMNYDCLTSMDIQDWSVLLFPDSSAEAAAFCRSASVAGLPLLTFGESSAEKERMWKFGHELLTQIRGCRQEFFQSPLLRVEFVQFHDGKLTENHEDAPRHVELQAMWVPSHETGQAGDLGGCIWLGMRDVSVCRAIPKTKETNAPTKTGIRKRVSFAQDLLAPSGSDLSEPGDSVRQVTTFQHNAKKSVLRRKQVGSLSGILF